MSTTQQNPLSGFFRSAVIHIKLPSGGRFWDDGSLNIPVTGELPVLPLTTKDEITIRTPDALLNGSGVVETIQSCVPGILDAWKMPSIDVDYVLMAMRIASYGSDMPVKAKCPHCGEENEYDIDLHQAMATIQVPNYDEPILANGLTIKMRPQKYFEATKTNKAKFEEEQILNVITDDSLDDEQKKLMFSAHLKTLVDLNTEFMVNSTLSITTPDGMVVTNPEFLLEFYSNSGRDIVKIVKKWLEDAAALAKVKPVNVTCDNCKKPYEVNLTFDYSSFFG